MISIIVPVYNAERYLSGCVNSLLKQTYKNFEVILVDDGSTDQSPEICDLIASKDSRIRVIHQNNSGVSSARNKGIELSSGEWVGFIDADDLVTSKYLESFCPDKFVSADYIRQGYLSLLNGKITAKLSHISWERRSYKYMEGSMRKILKRGFIPPNSVWATLFKRSTIIRNCIKFREELTNGEDAVFCHEFLASAERMVIINSYRYIYREQRPGSLSSNIFDPISFYNHLELSLLYRQRLYTKSSLPSPYPSNSEFNWLKLILSNAFLLKYSRNRFAFIITRMRTSSSFDLHQFRPPTIKGKIFKFALLRFPLLLLYFFLKFTFQIFPREHKI